MRELLAKAALALLTPRGGKAAAAEAPSAATPTPNAGGPIDEWGRRREPTPFELVRALRNTAYTCASINARVCASFAPRLYVVTRPGEPAPKCRVRPADATRAKQLAATLRGAVARKAHLVHEVQEHPAITLMERANPVHTGFELLELLQLYLEMHGTSYWHPEPGPLGVPVAVWPLPSHLIRPVRLPKSPQVVDYYEYWGTTPPTRFAPDEILPFRYPDPRQPYVGGLSPLRACYENVSLDGAYTALRSAVVENRGYPGAILSPKDAISPAERDRVEQEYRRKFSKGGQGSVLVTDEAMDFKTVQHPLGDLATLAEKAATKEDIANAFDVPLSYLTQETNLANLEAAQIQHAQLGIRPRLRRRDDALTEIFLPLFDGSGRLFFESDDPSGIGPELTIKREKHQIDTGLRTLNEIRQEHGWEPVPWGETPWLKLTVAPTDFERRYATVFARQVGRNKPKGANEQDPKPGDIPNA